jgi:NAD(P)-dependent dehydrogenase (short-subunit alcohol dehydrogenase family)
MLTSTLTGQRVLVVGGTSGIGAAVARSAMAAGAIVVTASRTPDSGDGNGGAGHIVLDITDEEAVRSALAGLPAFDHLVVSAGGARQSRFRGAGTDLAVSGFETKFWGAWRVAALAPLTAKASITFVSGVFAERPAAGQVAASCANAALEALARALAIELGPIRVNAVSPGLVDTPMWHAMPQERRTAYFAEVAAKLPARQICSAGDVAALVLACMTNPVLTGTVLKVDGGYTLV